MQSLKNAALDKRRLSLGAPKSFASYLSELKLPALSLEDTYEAAARAYAKGSPTSGTAAERLGASGLSASGLRDYLEKAAVNTRKTQTANAYADYLKAQSEARQGYAAYLDGYEKSLTTLKNRVTSYAKNNRVTDTDTLRAYAKSLGLSDTVAEGAAKDAAAHALRAMRESVLKTVVTYNMGEVQARAYALAQGLDSAAAERIARFAKAMRDAVIDDLDLPSVFEDNEGTTN